MLYAKKGEAITCENGHLVGTFTRDVLLGESTQVAAIEWAIDRPPQSGEPIAACRCQCGASFVRGDVGVQAHIGNEWRGREFGNLPKVG